jgi:hypothetical protein
MKNPDSPFHSMYILIAVIGLTIASISILRHLSPEWCMENKFLFVTIITAISMSPPLIVALRERRGS